MSVLSRPTRHHATAPTQREVRIPLPRTAPKSESSGDTALRPSAPPVQPAPKPGRRRTTMIVGGGLVAALAIGTGAFLILDDDGGSTTVIAPAYVPDAADLGRDAAAAARAPEATVAVVTEAERVAELARRSQNFTGQNEMYVTGSGTAVSDADRLSEAERDAAIARRSQNFVE